MGDRELLALLRGHLEAVTTETGWTHKYDAWTEARKALAHELLALFRQPATPAKGESNG